MLSGKVTISINGHFEVQKREREGERGKRGWSLINQIGVPTGDSKADIIEIQVNRKPLIT